MINLKRARELLEAWESGAAREEDVAELRGMLPEIFDNICDLRRDLDWFVSTAENVIDSVLGAEEEETQEVREKIAATRAFHNLPR